MAEEGATPTELVGTLSLAADLGLGQPMEHIARSCLIAVDLADRLGADRRTTYQVALLAFVGCTADSHGTAPKTVDTHVERILRVGGGAQPPLGRAVRDAARPADHAGARRSVGRTPDAAAHPDPRSRCEGGPPLPSLMERYVAAGGQYLVCPICVDAKKLDAGSFVRGAELGGAVPLWQWIGDEGVTTFSF